MPVLINAAANLILGSLVARATYNPDAPREGYMTWPLVMLVVFQSLVLVPVGAFLFRFYPDWSMHYAFDPRVFVDLDRWIGVLALAVVVVNMLLSVLGYACTERARRDGRSFLMHACVVFGILTIVGVLSQLWRRSFWVGGYDAYWQGEAKLLFMHPAGWAGLLAYIAAIVFYRWILRRYGVQRSTP